MTDHQNYPFNPYFALRVIFHVFPIIEFSLITYSHYSSIESNSHLLEKWNLLDQILARSTTNLSPTEIKPEPNTYWQSTGYPLAYLLLNWVTHIGMIEAQGDLMTHIPGRAPNKNWTRTWVGHLILYLTLFTSSRDFCFLFSLMLKFGFSWLLHFPLFTLWIFQNFLGLAMLVSYEEREEGDLGVWRWVKVVLGKIIQILVGLYVGSIVDILTSGFLMVICQNLIWVTLVFYSIWTRNRVENTKNGLKMYGEMFSLLLISFSLTFTTNFQYIFVINNFSHLEKIWHWLLFLAIQTTLILWFFTHQTHHCAMFVPSTSQHPQKSPSQ